MILTVVDLETTGLSPPAEVIEIGWQDVHVDERGARLGNRGGRFFSAPGGIPPETMAVHHIRPELLKGYRPWSECDMEEVLHGDEIAACDGSPPLALVAHNAAFEGQWLTPEFIGRTPMICTMKAASRVWPDAPGFGNQVLRYWLDLKLDDRLADPPHRAEPDAYVTANILIRLLARASIDDLIAWSSEPRVMPTIPFGKHKGAKWADAPRDYLEWVLRSDLDADTKWNAQRELTRRKMGVPA